MNQNDARKLLEAWDFFEKNPNASSWEGFSRHEFFTLMAVVTGEKNLPDAKAYLEKIAAGTISETVPQKIVEAAKEGKISEKELGRVEKTISSTRAWIARLEVKNAEEVAERQVRVAETKALLKEIEEEEGEPEEIAHLPTPVISGRGMGTTPAQGEKPKEPSVGFSIQVKPGVPSAPISLQRTIRRTTLNLAFAPFNLVTQMGAATLAETDPEKATAATLISKGITPAKLTPLKQQALASGISSSQFDKLIATMSNLPTSGLTKAIYGYGTWADVADVIYAGRELSISSVQIGQMFLIPSSDASSLVLTRPSFVGGIFSQVGTRLFGRATSSLLARMIGGTAVKAGAAGAGAAAGGGAAAAGGAAAGAAAGTAVAPVIGTVIGAVVGWVTSKIPDLISWLKRNSKDFGAAAIALILGGVFLGSNLLVASGLGVGVVSLAAGGGGVVTQGAQTLVQGLYAGLTTLVLPSLAVPLVIAFVTLPVLIAFIFLIINSGAFVVPAQPTIGGILPSPGGTLPPIPGGCQVPQTGLCALDNPITKIGQTFGNQAENAAKVCQAESRAFGFVINDNCLRNPVYVTDPAKHDGDYSVGLFQVNMLAHPNPAFLNTPAGASLKDVLARHGGKLCYEAFSNYKDFQDPNYYRNAYRNLYCEVADQSLLNDCVSWFQDPANNVAYAFFKSEGGNNWSAWTTARRCGIVK